MNSMRVVLDLNVFVSALIGRPATRSIFDHWRDEHFIVVLSSQLVSELMAVLARPKIQRYITESDAIELVRLLKEHAEVVVPKVRLDLSRDTKDNILLEVAASAQADYLVTGDKDLLDDPRLIQTMREEYAVAVIPPNLFLRLLEHASE